jgi:hypothetical protein
MKKHTIYLLAISITEEMEGDGGRMEGGMERGWRVGGMGETEGIDSGAYDHSLGKH